MIEFGLKHRHSSSWHKKFPRQKIERNDPKHLGMHEHLRFRNEWFEGRQGYLSWKDINKFLERHLGENVDKVFSEYVKRAKKYKHNANLKNRFFESLDTDRWYNDYTIDSQKRIVKIKRENNNGMSYKEAEKYNKEHLPESFKPYMKECELVYVGHFYIKERGWKGKWVLSPVFIINKEWYNTVMEEGIGKEFVKYSNMARICIHVPKYHNINYSDKAIGVPKCGYSTIYEKTGHTLVFGNGLEWDLERPVRIPYTYILGGKDDFIFLAKGTNWERC